jgi:CHAT domain-containing protein/tetratricopeptide (TPR) repeat protein
MSSMRIALVLALGALCALGTTRVEAVSLPPTCTELGAAPADPTDVRVLRKKIEKLIDSDPDAAIRLMCVTIPRVEREQGGQSLELALWAQALATPLIAYKDRLAEAVPLLQFAAPILQRRLGPDAPEVAEIHVAYAWMYFRQGRMAECADEWQRALRIRERVPGVKQVELQKVLVGLAQARLYQRRFDEAQRALERAQDILLKTGETQSDAAAAIENALTNIFLRKEDYTTARLHAESQIRIELKLRAARGAAQLVPVYVLLGQILERLDEFEASEQALRNAVFYSEAKDGPPQRQRLRAYSALGALLSERGQPTQALDFATRALQVGEEQLGPDAPALVSTLITLADIERSLGDLPKALHLYERAGRIVDQHSADVEKPILVEYFRGRGTLESLLGDFSSSQTMLLAGLQAAGDAPDLSTVRADILTALAHSAGTDPQERQQRLRQALSLYRARLPDAHPAILRALNELCATEIEIDASNAPDCDEAVRRVQQPVDAEPALVQAVYENGSHRAERLSHDDEAYAIALQSLAVAAALGTPDPLWRAHFQIARSLYRRNEATLAIFFGKQAIAQLQRLRSYFNGSDRALDRTFLQDKVDVYRTVADWLMSAGRIDEGLDVLKLLKTEELFDFVLRDEAGSRAPGSDVPLTGAEQALAAGYASALGVNAAAGAEIDRLSRLRETGRLSPIEQRRMDGLLAGQQQAASERAKRLGQFISAGIASAPPATSAGTDEVNTVKLQRELRRFSPDTALVVYLLTQSRLRVLIATRSGQTVLETPVQEAQLKREIGHFLASIAAREDIMTAARHLYALLLQPVDQFVARITVHHLVLWTDGALRYVPFAALHDGNHYAIEKYTIQLLSSIDGGAAPAHRTLALRVRGLGVTQPVAGYEALPGVADELCDLVDGPIEGLAARGSACPQPGSGQGVLPGAGFADSAFTQSRFEALMSGSREFSLLHLGTHFSLRPGNALRSFLVLGDGSHLTLDRVGALDFSGIQLVTLSACQTALGGATTDDGHEVEGLSALVQRRGAQEVIASLWRVEDTGTALLMHTLYTSLAHRPSDTPGALQAAQRALLDGGRHGRPDYRHPYYWAGFILSSRPP